MSISKGKQSNDFNAERERETERDRQREKVAQMIEKECHVNC